MNGTKYADQNSRRIPKKGAERIHKDQPHPQGSLKAIATRGWLNDPKGEGAGRAGPGGCWLSPASLTRPPTPGSGSISEVIRKTEQQKHHPQKKKAGQSVVFLSEGGGVAAAGWLPTCWLDEPQMG